METSQQAGAVAPRPSPLPAHTVQCLVGPIVALCAIESGKVLLGTHVGELPRELSPAEARLLAVYLVDCANAVDNPADRVIVDGDQVGEGIGHE